jgi:hypothetical protein
MLSKNDDRTITALVEDVLRDLYTNLEDHREIVQEARDGYLTKAEAALGERMAQLREGRLVSLSFDLTPPQDHSREFRTVIKMLELHKEAHDAQSVKGNRQPSTIELKAADVRKYVLNDWGWMDHFLAVSSAYSQKAAMMVAERP